LVGREVGPPFRSLATLGDVGDGPDCRSGFVDAAAAARAAAAAAQAAVVVEPATAAVRVHNRQSVPSPPPAVWGAEPGPSGTEGWGASRGRRRYSGNMIPGDIQAPEEKSPKKSSK